MNIMITGGAGFVGLNLIKELSAHNHIVRVIDRDLVKIDRLKKIIDTVEAYHFDLAVRSEHWMCLFEGVDAVIQLQGEIASTNQKDYVHNNIDSVQNLVDACRANEVKHLIHIGSQSSTANYENDYAVTKRKGEELVRDSGLPYTVLRPAIMFGEYDVHLMGKLRGIMRYSPVIPLPGDGLYKRQPLYVKYLCQIISSLLNTQPSNQTIKVYGEEAVTFYDMGKRVS